MSCCLGLYRIKAMSERNVALKFACVLLVSGKLHSFHGKHEVITITSPRQAVKFRVWYRDNHGQLEPELECVSATRGDTCTDDFTAFAPTCTNVSSDIVSNDMTPTTPISIPVLPSGTVTSSNDLLDTLKSVWGYSTLKPLQQKAIDSIISGNDTMVVIPTGGGKSLVFQLPAVCNHRPAIVVSPLIALINDQITDLRSKGIGAESFTGETDSTRRQQILYQMRCGDPELKLIYTTPETINHDVAFKEIVKILGEKDMISYLIYDEAHCISQWGNGFRPDYLTVAEMSRTLVPEAPIILLSATATQDVISDIKQKIGLGNLNIVQGGFDRPNLFYKVQEKGKETNSEMIDIMFSAESGLIYCATKIECEEISALLEAAEISSQPYHAGLSKAVKDSLQQNWTKGVIKVLCCTSAFGMGINKPNVRVVMFHSLPSCLEELFQGWGRAGRDGLQATCYLYFSFGDRNFHIRNICDQFSYDSQVKTSAVLRFQKVLDFVMAKNCRRTNLISYFDPEEASLTACNACDNCRETTIRQQASNNDFTPQITRIIEFLQGTERSITIKYLAQIVSGKLNKKVRDNGDERSSIFGILKCTVNTCELCLRHIVTKDILREVPPPRTHGVSNCSYLQLSLGSQYLQYVSGQTKLMYHSL